MAAGALSLIQADDITILERQAYASQGHLFVIGPGASGKTSLGQALANHSSYRFVDMDEQFLARFGDIGAYIHTHGYTAYRIANSRLANALAGEAIGRTIFATSSGFLTADNPTDVLTRNHALLANGYSICVLPALDMEEAVPIIVARQLARPFARGAAREEAVIRERFPLYAALGDILVASTAPPARIAAAIFARLAPLDPSSLRR